MKYCVLITDISHFVAQAVAVGLLREGYRVIGLVDQPAFIKPVGELIKDHVKDTASLNIKHLENHTLATKKAMLEHCDIIFHILPPPPILSEKGRIDWVRSLHHETLQWLEAAEHKNIHKFVHTSSILSLRYNMKDPTVHLIDGQSLVIPQWETMTPFATQVVKSDIANWDYVKTKKLESIFTAVYIPTIFGHFKGYSTTPFIRLMQKMADGQFLFLPKIEWPGIDVEDVVKTHLEIINNDMLMNKRLILADETVSLMNVKDIMVSLKPSLKKNMPRLTPPALFSPLLKQFIPQHKMIMDELSNKVVANSKYTRELLQTTFIPTEDALVKTLKDIIKSL